MYNELEFLVLRLGSLQFMKYFLILLTIQQYMQVTSSSLAFITKIHHLVQILNTILTLVSKSESENSRDKKLVF